MFKKREIRDYIWVFPLVAGFLAILAILSPTALCNNRMYSSSSFCVDWWMWNFTRMGDNSIILFISEMDFIIPSILTTSAVLLSAINLLIISIATRRGTLKTKDFELMSTISAALSIGIMIYYITAIDIAFFDGVTINSTIFRAGYHFWKEFHLGFGIFLPFISAGLSIIGIGVSRNYSNRKEVIVPA